MAAEPPPRKKKKKKKKKKMMMMMKAPPSWLCRHFPFREKPHGEKSSKGDLYNGRSGHAGRDGTAPKDAPRGGRPIR